MLPKEFVLYSDNRPLQYIVQQPKLNQRHVKWVEYLQNSNFVIKHISGQSNKIADALSKRTLIMQENQVQITVFDSMKELYEDDVDFKEAFEACKNIALSGHNSMVRIYNTGWFTI